MRCGCFGKMSQFCKCTYEIAGFNLLGNLHFSKKRFDFGTLRKGRSAAVLAYVFNCILKMWCDPHRIAVPEWRSFGNLRAK